MGFRVAIVGATGAVGQELLQTLERRKFPVSELQLLASERSAGKRMTFQGTSITVEALNSKAFNGCEVAFFSAGAGRSREFAPRAVEMGALVIDNSSAFRMDPTVPLVIPEINIDHARHHQGIIANPNCSAIILLMAVAPLMTLAKVERIVVSTYQAASGAGAKVMQELLDQTRDYLEGKPVVPKALPHPYAFNLFSHNTPINEQGYNEEEWKVVQESRKILDRHDLRIGVTCVRVPVLRAHSESITVEFDHRPALEAVYGAYERFLGVRVVDDKERNHFPMPLDASGEEEILVGRIREDISHPNAVSLFASGDQLLKGAALNAVQIAEAVL